MGKFVNGTVVVLNYPFSDLSASKRRPAVVLGDAGLGDVVVCQLTSQAYTDRQSVRLDAASFDFGGLPEVSYARPGKLFTAHERLIIREAGTLKPEAYARVRDAVIHFLKAGS